MKINITQPTLSFKSVIPVAKTKREKPFIYLKNGGKHGYNNS